MKKYIIPILLALPAVIFAQNAPLTSAMLGKMEARHIGPAVTGGRITAIDGVNSDPRILYVGTGGGGVWKTTNGGSQFKPVFDKQPQSIGCIAVDQKHPDIVWVGTGESNMRNSVSIGNGIYKTTDAGENWVNMGLPNSEHISKIILHPGNPDIIYASVPGHLWDDSPDRGLYKTIDGGKTWNKMLYVDEKTGCADVVMDPRNPDVLIASMWQFRRKPFAFISGGPGSGLFKSIDGGKTWKKITNGLPETEIGRIALAQSPVSPDNIVAIVESKKAGLYISTDNGESWKSQSADDNVTARPFYFSCVAYDPIDAKKVYRPGFEFSFSSDGGYSWSRAQNSSGWVHVDMHAFYINPKNTSHMYLGTDGGLYMSVDKGNNWIYLNNLPVAQLYHVQIDKEEPYNVYCGLQDNGSWKAASQHSSGINNGDWLNVGGGDGFWVQPDRQNASIVFSEYQGGHIAKVDLKTNQAQDVQPQALAGEEKLRYNWNTPICISPTDPTRLYIGAQYLYRTTNRGLTWTRLSADLTTNDPNKKKQEESGGVTVDNTSAENHCTIFTMAESPLDKTLIYVGTDDGNLQVSKDDGKSWSNLADNYKAASIPAQTWVSSIEPSHFDKNVLYATFDNHMYGDMKTYLAKSVDGGAHWTGISSPVFKGYAHKIIEDPVDKDLLFLGTEWGLYMTLDGGKNWIQMKAKVPDYVAIRDMQIDTKTNDLVIATHGRGILIIDDISPLRAINSNMLNSNVACISTKPYAVTTGHYGGSWPNAGGFVGPNSTEDAIIAYYLKDRVNSGDVKVNIYDANDKLMVTLPGTKRKGINMITWNMRSNPPKVATGGAKADWSSTVGPLVKPGKYKISIVTGKETAKGELVLTPDGKANYTPEDRSKNYETVDNVFHMQEGLAGLMDSVLAAEQKIKPLIEAKKASAQMQAYYDSLEVVRSTIVAVKEGTAITGEEKIRERLSDLYFGVSFDEGRPTDSQFDRLRALDYDINKAHEKFGETQSNFLPKLKAEMPAAPNNGPK
jgi:photosystem II stability/assembly factor-like uncharacterized protein